MRIVCRYKAVKLELSIDKQDFDLDITDAFEDYLTNWATVGVEKDKVMIDGFEVFDLKDVLSDKYQEGFDDAAPEDLEGQTEVNATISEKSLDVAGHMETPTRSACLCRC